MSGTLIGARKHWSEGLLERFNKRINKTDYCWIWIGKSTTGKSHGEYGTFWDGNRIVLAHRFSLEQSLGRELKKGMKVLHHCDNSICVRPDHLYEGTQGDNMKDAYKRNRRSGKEQNKMLMKARFDKLGY